MAKKYYHFRFKMKSIFISFRHSVPRTLQLDMVFHLSISEINPTSYLLLHQSYSCFLKGEIDLWVSIDYIFKLFPISVRLNKHVNNFSIYYKK